MKDYMRGLDDFTFDKVAEECRAKVEGLSDKDWQDIVEEYDLGIHRDVLRKAYTAPLGGYAMVKHLEKKMLNTTPKNKIEEISDIIGELDIKKQEIKTQTSKLNKIKRELIKTVEIANDIKTCIIENTEIPVLDCDRVSGASDNKLIVGISDWHISYVINNYKGNSYNYEIAQKRLNKLLQEIRKTCELYNINTVVVANQGDIIENSYMRNTNQAYECEFNMSEQIVKGTQLLFSFIKEIADMGNNVEYYSCSSNHARMCGLKDSNIDGDDANVIINETLKTYVDLSKDRRIHINEVDHIDGTSEFELNGMMFKVMHGDNRPTNDKKLFDGETSSHDKKYKAILRGHFHNFNITTQNSNGYVITTGCLFGYNGYSMKRMLCNTYASQTLIVVNADDIECVRNVNLQIN